MQSEQFVEETFKGSLPAFLTAFNTRKKLSNADIDELQKLIDKTDVAYVCYDGVHPTCNGHEVISRVVYEELKKIL